MASGRPLGFRNGSSVCSKPARSLHFREPFSRGRPPLTSQKQAACKPQGVPLVAPQL